MPKLTAEQQLEMMQETMWNSVIASTCIETGESPRDYNDIPRPKLTKEAEMLLLQRMAEQDKII